MIPPFSRAEPAFQASLRATTYRLNPYDEGIAQHVEGIGQQRRRPREQARDDLDHEHRER